MKRYFRSCLVAGGVVLGSVGAHVQQLPVEEVITIATYDAPPKTLEGALATSDAVARVRVTGKRYFVTAVGTPQTAYQVELLESLKSHGELVPSFEVIRTGGERYVPGKKERHVERHFSDFRIGGEYVVFLSWNFHSSKFGVTFGPDGVYELGPGGAVDSPGRSPLAGTLRGKSFAEALRLIRDTRAKK